MSGKFVSVLVVTVMMITAITCEYANGLNCSLAESKNISNGQRFANGSILYEGIEYHKDQYAPVGLAMARNTSEISVPTHTRGCTCDIKACIRFFCPIGYAHTGIYCQPSDVVQKTFTHQITDASGANVSVVLNDQFAIMSDRLCDLFFPVDDYALFHDGTVKVSGSHCVWNHQNATFRASISTASATQLQMLFCFDEMRMAECFSMELLTTSWFPYSAISIETDSIFSLFKLTRLFFPNGWLFLVMLSSVPFFLATILVYACSEERRNTRGVILMCYLATLSISYIILSFIETTNDFTETDVVIATCKHIIFVIFFVLTSTFLWTNVLSLDVWWKFCMKSQTNIEDCQFLCGSMAYAWGFALFLAYIFTYYMDNGQIRMSLIESTDRINVGCCYVVVSTARWKVFPVLLAIITVIDVTLFVCTALSIFRTKQTIESGMRNASESTQSGLRERDKESFWMYFRLFALNGLHSILLILLIIFNPARPISMVCNVLIALQGAYIFHLFVLRQHAMRAAIESALRRCATGENQIN